MVAEGKQKRVRQKKRKGVAVDKAVAEESAWVAEVAEADGRRQAVLAARAEEDKRRKDENKRRGVEDKEWRDELFRRQREAAKVEVSAGGGWKGKVVAQKRAEDVLRMADLRRHRQNHRSRVILKNRKNDFS